MQQQELEQKLRDIKTPSVFEIIACFLAGTVKPSRGLESYPFFSKCQPIFSIVSNLSSCTIGFSVLCLFFFIYLNQALALQQILELASHFIKLST